MKSLFPCNRLGRNAANCARQCAGNSSMLKRKGEEDGFHGQRKSVGYAAPRGASREKCEGNGGVVHETVSLQRGIPGCYLGDAGVRKRTAGVCDCGATSTTHCHSWRSRGFRRAEG